MVTDLVKWNIYPRKTYTYTMPKIKKCLQWHYIRGIIDADGCFYFHRRHKTMSLTILGTEEELNQVRSIFIRDNIIREGSNLVVIKNPEKRVWSFYCGGNLQISKLLEILYKDATIYLDRKYDYLANHGYLPPRKKSKHISSEVDMKSPA